MSRHFFGWQAGPSKKPGFAFRGLGDQVSVTRHHAGNRVSAKFWKSGGHQRKSPVRPSVIFGASLQLCRPAGQNPFVNRMSDNVNTFFSFRVASEKDLLSGHPQFLEAVCSSVGQYPFANRMPDNVNTFFSGRVGMPPSSCWMYEPRLPLGRPNATITSGAALIFLSPSTGYQSRSAATKTSLQSS